MIPKLDIFDEINKIGDIGLKILTTMAKINFQNHQCKQYTKFRFIKWQC